MSEQAPAPGQPQEADPFGKPNQELHPGSATEGRVVYDPVEEAVYPEN
jgi:hypothetical protein